MNPLPVDKVTLCKIDALRPAVYNPRKSDERRLNLTRLSLTRLGWLLPIYASSEGEILSGHQRHLMATKAGFKFVPVVRMDGLDENERRCVNILFNRGTNDMGAKTRSSEMKHEIADKFLDLVDSLPALNHLSQEAFPCLRQRVVPVRAVMDANGADAFDAYAHNISDQLYRKNVRMPVVVTEDLQLVNGAGRVQVASARGFDSVHAVVIPNERREFARTLLNLLSMDFDVEERYGDILRYNSFRRAAGVRFALGRGFVYRLEQRHHINFEHEKPENAALWKATYGTKVLDFGAGQRQESGMLRKIGVSAIPFEPFCLDKSGEIDRDLSLKVCRAFLDTIRTGIVFDSIFISSVLQSVPFPKDREHVVTLLSALSSPATTVYGLAKGYGHNSIQSSITGIATDRTTRKQGGFLLDHEEGVRLTEAGARPKIQKFYHLQEFGDLFRKGFEEVGQLAIGEYVTATCRFPKKLDIDALREAIEFEFDLPYPNGERMGLVEEAKQAFAERLDLVGLL